MISLQVYIDYAINAILIAHELQAAWKIFNAT
jgi:hypothetical protein